MKVERSSARRTTNNVRMKVKVAVKELKDWSDGVRNLELKKKGSKRVQSRGNDNGDVSYVNGKLSKTSSRGKRDMKLKSGNEGKLSRISSRGKRDMKLKSGNEVELSKTRGRGKREMKLKSGNEGQEAVIHGNSGHKRKRIYVDPGMAVDRTYERNVKKQDGKSMSKVEKGVRSFFNKEKLVPQGKCHELGDQKNLRGKIKSADVVNNAQKNSLENGTLKTEDKRKAPFATKIYQNQRKHAVDSIEKPHTKRVSGKKSLATDSELMEDLPKKKKKRVIRIDPNDTSNKRLNDDTANSGNSKEQKDLAEKADVEMSKNAKFRAIRPSSSILSFVEDNLLGRRRDIEFRRAGYNTELSAPLDNIPFSTSSERERIEVPEFRNKLEFFAAAKISSSFPSPDLPEIAFAGRSNVGKSSLLNALTRQWGVVRTSDKPGLTQTVNFFKLGPKLSLVDLPGYGFAYAKNEVKEAWEELVKEYVTSRFSLKRVCLLIDTKWGMKPRDHELIDLMERSQTKYQIVLTKTDLVFPITVARRAMEIEESLKAKKSAIQPLMMVSSRTGAGIRSLRTVLASVARFVKL